MRTLLAGVNWSAFRLLLAAGLLGVIAVLPYVHALVESGTFGQVSQPAIPMPLILVLALVQNGILLAIAILIGMSMSKRTGLRMPLIDAWATGAPASFAEAGLWRGMLIGVAVGIAMVAIEAIVFLPYLPPSMESLFTIPLWKRLLGGVVYGGITEELFMRLFLMSSIAAIAGRWWKAADGRPAPGAFWIAILVVAVLFGLGHLPATSAVTPLTTAIVARALVLNGIAGVAFGYLYWKRGLEAAMAAHMGAHLVLQIPGAVLLARLT